MIGEPIGLEGLHYIGPPLVLLIGAVVLLTWDIVTRRGAPVREIALATLVAGAAYLVLVALGDTRGPQWHEAIVVDEFSIFFGFLLLIVSAAVTLVSHRDNIETYKAGEFYSLLLISTGAMMVLAQANDLISLFIALETTSIAQFIMVGIGRRDRSSEAGLKYLLYGAVAAAILLYGFALLFGLAGSTTLTGVAQYALQDDEGTRLALLFALVLVTAGVGFKMAIVPFHAWVPDVYQGAPLPVTTFLSVASKAAGFAIALRIFYTGLGGGETFVAEHWGMMFGVFAAVSMIAGNTAAIMQTNVKRLLGYSSIAQAGNVAVGLAAVAAGATIGPAGVLFFLGTYVATNLGAFIAVIAATEKLQSEELSDYAGLLRRSPMTALVLIVCLLSLTGIPPTAGFIAKLYIFNAAIAVDATWLAALVAVAVVNTAISAYYYLRWVRTMVLDEPLEASTFRPAPAAQGLLLAAAAGVLLIGVIPSPLIQVAERAAAVLP